MFSSPLSRTLETAEILARPHGLAVEKRDGLREIGHGHFEGLKRAEVEQRFTAEYLAWESDPFTVAPAGGESGAAVIVRALPVIRDIVLAHPDDVVLVISHKATLRLVLASLLGIDPRGYRDRLEQSPACLNVLDFKGPLRARLMLFNDISHYATEPRKPERNLSLWWEPAGPDAPS